MARVVYVKSARVRFDKETNQRKPLHTCDRCAKYIEIGAPYKHMSIKTSQFSSRMLVRCGDCPVWNTWEYSSSLSARLDLIEHEARTGIEATDDQDEIASVLTAAAYAVRELAEEKRESAQNIEDGFGHTTGQSEELTEQAEELDAWADEIEGTEVPDMPDPEAAECEACNGTGYESNEKSCDECNGTGHPEEPTDEQIDEWRQEVEVAVDVLGNCPV